MFVHGNISFSLGPVLVDAEAALHAFEVKSLCDRHGVTLFVAPKGIGWMLLPADQRAHSSFKREYYKLLALAPSGPLSEVVKFGLWRRAFWNVSQVTLESYFGNLGLLDSEEPTIFLGRRLFAEGASQLAEHTDEFREQLRAYLRRRRESQLSFSEIVQRRHVLEGTIYWEDLRQFL
jgi:hypothetical protein